MDSVFLLREDIDLEINIVGVYRTEQEAKIAAGYYSYNYKYEDIYYSVLEVKISDINKIEEGYELLEDEVVSLEYIVPEKQYLATHDDILENISNEKYIQIFDYFYCPKSFIIEVVDYEEYYLIIARNKTELYKYISKLRNKKEAITDRLVEPKKYMWFYDEKQ